MEVLNIKTSVKISPNELGMFLYDMLYKKLIDLHVGVCSKQYGYVVEILRFTHVYEYKLSRVNQFIYVDCDLEVLTIRPRAGLCYYSVVKTVYQRGVFVSLINIFDTLLPLDMLQKAGYMFDPTVSTFVHTESKKSINVGEIENVEVVDVSYDSKTFNCIAKLVAL